MYVSWFLILYYVIGDISDCELYDDICTNCDGVKGDGGNYILNMVLVVCLLLAIFIYIYNAIYSDFYIMIVFISGN